MMRKYNGWWFSSVFILLSFILLNGEKVLAQTKIQVITKTISKNIPYKTGKTIKIVGEKATVSIQSWDKNYISATISLIAKHPNKKTAEDDIRFIEYKVFETDNTIEISNFFSQKTGFKEITSNLNARFELFVPESSPLSIVLVYGSASIINAKGSLSLDLSFAQLTMKNIEGETKIKTYYGDIEAEDICSNLNIQSEMADLTLRNLSGSCFIQSKYGNLVLVPTEKLKNLDINSNRSTVTILIEKLDGFSFKFETQNADIKVPEVLKKQVVNNLFSSQFQQNSNKPLVQVKGKYSPITLKNN